MTENQHRVIPLERDNFQAGSEPSRLDLSIIENWMLYPHPDESHIRERNIETATLEYCGPLRLKELLSPTLQENLFLAALAATPPATIREEKEEPRCHGIVVGSILRDVIGSNEINLDASIGSFVKRWGEELSKRKYRVSESTIRNTIWPRMKRVAHFWAARVELVHKNYYAGEWLAPVCESESNRFPCQLDQLRDFLAVAEAYRLKGETIRPKRSPTGTVLDPTETLRLPDFLEIAPAPLQFDRRS